MREGLSGEGGANGTSWGSGWRVVVGEERWLLAQWHCEELPHPQPFAQVSAEGRGGEGWQLEGLNAKHRAQRHREELPHPQVFAQVGD